MDILQSSVRQIQKVIIIAHADQICFVSSGGKD